MLELDAGQLDRLQRVRDDEVIERVLLEVRREAPSWLERRGLLPAIRQLGELRATALELGIEEPGTIERFLLHGLAFPGFQDTPAFLAHMRRPLADSPEQRFQDYERIVEFRLASQKWRAYETSGRPA
ncbi:TPA: hypothetical protein NH847_001558 [Pseudomonas aeruginosa]|uniref:hypothetical protein n=1 Tax=Pseudomonas aeruginosa TaxID=287 RepID=UPI00053D6A89|nr:hypothetical protein [Pseudomonas aeruginosa]MDJ1396366.1 hypothetical protein [Pseudomonas aeruginosa]MDU0686716.1 hypothetical protein [Pseudomonas aeruginosa]PBX15115.1 hypothetical protein CJT84_27720 [Pseudomonas aeruginosa]QGP95205.1 hypothetical protein FC629_05490 [Pseudomonas aeruginosa]RPP87107.1 hypothetical protein IPC1133_04960 [Pseudomonas aeruginosa]